MLQGKVQQTEHGWFNRQNRYGSTDIIGMVQQTEQGWFSEGAGKFSERNTV
jgi:hypothetical protein